MYDFHTRPRNFCSLCTPMEKYPGYGYALVEICGYCTGITRVIAGYYPYPTLVCVLHVRLPYPSPELLFALYTDGEIPGDGYALVELPECGYGY